MHTKRSGAFKTIATIPLVLAINVIMTGAIAAAPKRAGPDQLCGGIAGISCKAGLWCEPEAGQCRVADGSGRCVRPPEICPMNYAPVCGCNGRTYGNDCERRSHKVGLDHKGACK